MMTCDVPVLGLFDDPDTLPPEKIVPERAIPEIHQIR